MTAKQIKSFITQDLITFIYFQIISLSCATFVNSIADLMQFNFAEVLL